MSGAGSNSRISRNNSEKNSHKMGDINREQPFLGILNTSLRNEAFRQKGRANLEVPMSPPPPALFSHGSFLDNLQLHCLLLHAYYYPSLFTDMMLTQELEHRGFLMYQKMGLSVFLLKTFGLWLFCRLPCVIPYLSGMISTSIRYSHYCNITLLLLFALFFSS